MALNLLSPTGLNCLLIGDTVQAPGGSSDSIPSVTTIDVDGIFTPVSAALEIKSTEGALLLPRMTEDQRDDLITTPGMVLYNETSGEYNFNIGEDEWVSISANTGDVTGPDGAVEDNIAVFADNTGKLLADSGVSITQVSELLIEGRRAAPLDFVNQIGNIGHINFTGDNGSIFLDGLPGVQLFDNDGTSITVLMTGGNLGEDTETTSALLELKSTTQALLLSRMTTAQMNALITPPNADGMYLYNTDQKAFYGRQDGQWVKIVGEVNQQSIYSPTYNQQLVQVSSGWNQGGFGSSSVGTDVVLSMEPEAETVDFFDSAAVNENSKGFTGAIFYNGYVYFCPTYSSDSLGQLIYNGQITRYNTRLPFNNANSYEFFDTTTINLNSTRFFGAICDNNGYIYFVPSGTLPGESQGQITRYNTNLSFTDPGSYSVFNTATQVDVNSKGFRGAVFDGRRYIYFIPYTNGQITRYDTTLSFTNPASYLWFDTTTVDANSKEFWGGAWDGRYLYLVPYGSGGTSGQITRYDSVFPFDDSSSYEVFDTTDVHPFSKGFHGAVFDGKYVYFVPYNNDDVPSGQITRYDTTLSFTDVDSYDICDMAAAVTSSAKGFHGAVYDGRYIYYIPSQTSTLVRYDTTKSFHEALSYYPIDISVMGYAGGVYDGKSIYFSPHLANGATGDPFGNICRIPAYSGPQIPYATHGA